MPGPEQHPQKPDYTPEELAHLRLDFETLDAAKLDDRDLKAYDYGAMTLLAVARMGRSDENRIQAAAKFAEIRAEMHRRGL